MTTRESQLLLLAVRYIDTTKPITQEFYQFRTGVILLTGIIPSSESNAFIISTPGYICNPVALYFKAHIHE